MQLKSTPVPNVLFDIFLKDLQIAELKVLLVVIRQTLGWRDKQTLYGRKEIDWISNEQLKEKTGSSRRAISSAIVKLVNMHLIEVLDAKGTLLFDPVKRQGKSRLYFRLSFVLLQNVDNELKRGAKEKVYDTGNANFAEDLRKKRIALAQKMRITKETLQN